MVDYIVTKENTGVYNTRKAVHLPVELELQQRRNERWRKVFFLNKKSRNEFFLIIGTALTLRPPILVQILETSW